MKKIFAILLSSFLFINFIYAYNCGTIGNRTESLNLKIDNYKYQEQLLEYRSQHINSQYEAEILKWDIEALQSVSDQLQKEISDLQYEISRCNTQKEKIASYLKDAWIYENKMSNINNIEEFNESYLDKAIENYTNAYNLMKWDTRLSAWMDDQIKDKIDELKSLKAQYQKLKEYSNNISNTVGSSSTTVKSYSSKNDELIDAIQWMYDNWLTIYNTFYEFLPYNEITREQASKFFVEFAAKILWRNKGNVSNYDIFSDISNADPTLKDHIIYANNMWLFQWNKWKFMPFNRLTKAQALAVTVRMFDWYLDESWSIPYDTSNWLWYAWYSQYLFKANYSYNLNKWWSYSDFDKLDSEYITRWDMAIMLYDMYLYLQ